MALAADLILVAVVSSSLLLLPGGSPLADAEQFQAAATSTCHDGFMSVYLSKEQFADLPFSVYVRDDHSGYYQALAVADHCHYSLGETEAFTVLTAPSHGCFVKAQKYYTHLTVVVVALADRGRIEIVKSIRLMCERRRGGTATLKLTPQVSPPEVSENRHPLTPSHVSCSTDGFNITIRRSATVPPLNLDAVWIPSNRSLCEAQQRSREAVTFTFPFASCGTQSMMAEGIMTYWVNVEAKQHPQGGSIFLDTPFHLTVTCSFALAQIAHLDIEVEREDPPPTLRGEGRLRIHMRFAKDDRYQSFSSSHGPPLMAELGQPVHVEVFVVKHEDEDLTLLLEDCWATPTENPKDVQRWKLLVKGCPFRGDSHATAVLPVVSSKELRYPSLHKWFVVKMFSFVKPKEFENLVYFHCDVEICKGPGCSQSCSDGSRKLRRIPPRPGRRIPHSVVSGGPLIYIK